MSLEENKLDENKFEDIKKEDTFMAMILDQKPQFKITTSSYLSYQDFFSRKLANQVYINVDNPSEFHQELNEKLYRFLETEEYNG